MANLTRIKRGYDIKLVGEAAKEIATSEASKTYAIQPLNFKGAVPKLQVEVGDEVKAGSPLYFSKSKPEILFTSPVSGEVVEVKRGPKRVIEEIRILADSSISYEQFTKGDPSALGASGVKETLLKSGAWPLIKQRPFNRVAMAAETPRDIFISGFDSAPLAPDLNFALQGREQDFQAGINALSQLTAGKVYLGLNKKTDNAFFESINGVEKRYFQGPHPAGNVGVQIHHTAPINKGEVVWTLNAQDVAIIGKLFNEGIYDPERVITLAGSEVKEPKYIKTRIGASMASIIGDNHSGGNNRIISGSVLFGDTSSMEGYLGTYDQQVTIIPEGDDYEFLGWLIPNYPRPSISKTFLSYLMPNKKYKVNTNLHGEERAYVVTNEYEKVLPMDIYPVQLIKACMANDLEAMEALGIFEVVEEDMALCEFVCTSKIPVQQVLSDGLALIEKEG